MTTLKTNDGATDACAPKPSALMTAEDAVARIAAEIAPLPGVQTVALAEACGRVLAEDIVSALALPPFANSAMDGYAVHAADLRADAPTILPVVARIAAGDAPGIAVPRGAAARIFTGAPLPDGPDGVVMQEDCAVDGETVTIRPGVKGGDNVRPAGEDIEPGQTVLTRGSPLSPRHIALAAAVGRRVLRVAPRPRVALFSTGDELVDGQATPAPGKINDSNRPMLAALYRDWGCAVTDLGILPDDRPTIERALSAAASGHDVIVTSGGVSVGEEDHVRAALLALGGRLDFWKLRIKPGKPTAVGHLDGAVFLGLPGNPVASLVISLLIGYPILRALTGLTAAAAPRYPVVCGFSRSRKAGREEYFRVILRTDAQARLVAVAPEAQGSGILTTLAAADGLLVVPADTAEIRDGDILPFIPLGALRA